MIAFCCICLKAGASCFSFIYNVFRLARGPCYQDDYVGIKRVGRSLDFVPKWPKMELITSDPIQDRMGLWARKPSPLLALRPILILGLASPAQNGF
jgi:hypothetical protein